MKIFSADQIREWDRVTIENQQLNSIDLMERAATACSTWIMKRFDDESLHLKIFCGKGNNGGDGLAIARQVIGFYSKVSVYILETGQPGSIDFQENLKRFHQLSKDIHFLQEGIAFPEINHDDLIVDAIFGTGINKPVSGLAKNVIEYINDYHPTVISIDLPSGMFADKSSKDLTVVKASITLTCENYKLAFLTDENSFNFGEVQVLPIGLDEDFALKTNSSFELLDGNLAKLIYKPRHPFTHKGNYGHALLITGSYGLMGASVLAARACMRSGVGKLDCQVPSCGYEIMQNSVPEAMTVVNGIQNLNSFIPTKKYKAIGVGPGIGRYAETARLLGQLFKAAESPLIIDADALYALAHNQNYLKQLPEGSVLTPHGYEFEMLFGKTKDDFDRISCARENAFNLNCYIVLKGHHTMIVTPQGRVYFNTTGNAGMATGGSGDVLAGIITGLIAQSYPALEASLLGVYLHGLSGDIAAGKLSQESLIAGDIADHLGYAFKQLTV